MDFDTIDLRHDDAALWYVKQESVQVQFARADGSLMSREGPNHYQRGDAVVTGSNADRWTVSRQRFDSRYEPIEPLLHGQDGAYRNKPIPVLAKQVPQAFTVARSSGGDRLQGAAQDWLLQYAPGDWGIVENAKFQRVYRRLKPF